MLDWIKALRRGGKSLPSRHTAQQPEPTALGGQTRTSQPAIDLDGIYYGWLLGVASTTDSAISALEQELLHGLQSACATALSDPTIVPRVPAVIPQIMQSLRDDDASGAHLARQISRDPQLVADVVRIANSPYYRTVTAIRSLEHAVTVLGRNGLRQLLAAAALKPIINLQGGYFARLAIPRVWAHSQLCAAACACLGRAERLDTFESYLAGLLQNIGVVVAVRVLDRCYDSSDAPRSRCFHRAFAHHAHLLNYRILRNWELPAAVTTAVQDQSEAHSGDMSRLGIVLSVGDQISKLRLLADNGLAENRVEQLTTPGAGPLTARYSRCYEELSTVGHA